MISSTTLLENKIVQSFFTKSDKELNEIASPLTEDGLYYLQMRLPISKITREYIDNIKKRIGAIDLKIEVEEAIEEDLDSILSIHKKAWKDSHILFVPTNEETFELLFEYPETLLLKAIINGEIIGYIILDCEGKNKEFGVIDGMGILPEFQRKKIGLILCLEAWNYLKNMNFKEIHFETYIKNEKCIQLAKLLNFEPYGIKRYPYSNIKI